MNYSDEMFVSNGEDGDGYKNGVVMMVMKKMAMMLVYYSFAVVI